MARNNITAGELSRMYDPSVSGDLANIGLEIDRPRAVRDQGDINYNAAQRARLKGFAGLYQSMFGQPYDPYGDLLGIAPTNYQAWELGDDNVDLANYVNAVNRDRNALATSGMGFQNRPTSREDDAWGRWNSIFSPGTQDGGWAAGRDPETVQREFDDLNTGQFTPYNPGMGDYGGGGGGKSDADYGGLGDFGGVPGGRGSDSDPSGFGGYV